MFPYLINRFEGRRKNTSTACEQVLAENATLKKRIAELEAENKLLRACINNALKLLQSE